MQPGQVPMPLTGQPVAFGANTAATAMVTMTTVLVNLAARPNGRRSAAQLGNIVDTVGDRKDPPAHARKSAALRKRSIAYTISSATIVIVESESVAFQAQCFSADIVQTMDFVNCAMQRERTSTTHSIASIGRVQPRRYFLPSIPTRHRRRHHHQQRQILLLHKPPYTRPTLTSVFAVMSVSKIPLLVTGTCALYALTLTFARVAMRPAIDMGMDSTPSCSVRHQERQP